MADDQREEFREVSEVRAILEGVSEPDWRRARKLARRFCAPGCGWSPDELLDEAVTRSLSGERRWRVGMDPLPSLLGIMRSTASSWRKAKRRSRIDDRVEVALMDAAPADEDDEDSAPRVFAVDSVTPEDRALYQELLAATESAVEKDEEAHLIFLAWAEGKRGKEAIQQLGMDVETYEAARKRLKRTLDAVDDEWKKQ